MRRYFDDQNCQNLTGAQVSQAPTPLSPPPTKSFFKWFWDVCVCERVESYLFLMLGSGTMFLRPEKIQKHHTLVTVDTDKLKQLLIK